MSKPSSPREIKLALNRRRFLYSSALAAGGLAALPSHLFAKTKLVSPNGKLNIACIGVGGKGASDLDGAAGTGHNIVALCDVDANTLAKAGTKYDKAEKFRDYRKLYEKAASFDAVVISTPDHHHFPATMLALRAGKHVYCQKPLTHTIEEARLITQAARKAKVATQMGNQGHCGVGIREASELIRSGAIGAVTEVHSWSNRPIWPQGLNRPSGSDPVPAGLDWDLWIGPAAMRPFKADWTEEEARGWHRGATRPVYHPFSWRGWWDFGCGALGDMGCHVMDAGYTALKLGPPSTVELIEADSATAEMAPRSAVIRYQFPGIGAQPPVTFYWHDGGKKPEKPAEMEGAGLPESGSLFLGTKGKIVTGAYGENPTLLPESKMKGFTMPPAVIPRIPNNNPYEDWMRAATGGPEACSNFNVAGPFTEVVLLGNLAIRLREKIYWDPVKLQALGLPAADALIRKQYRAGWKV